MSRVVGGQALLDDVSKQRLVELTCRLARFCGLDLVTYCVMSNHFHVLVRVPEVQEVSDAELLERLRTLYGPKGSLVELAKEGMRVQGRIPEDLRRSQIDRMGDVSVFMKELKQRFSRWYNRRMDRFGTLWAERFKSVLVEDQPGAAGTLAAYIDLNPVRAGMVDDPKDYRFCGYAAALAGNKQVRAGLMSLQAEQTWKQASATYRQRLFVRAGVSGRTDKTALNREEIRRVLRAGGKLSAAQLLRLRIRHLTDGVVLGSKEFVNEVFAEHRSKFGAKRTSGARPIRGVALQDLSVLRDLRVAAVT